MTGDDGQVGGSRSADRAARDETLAAALGSGWARAEAGALVGLSERSVRRRLADPTFSADVARYRALHFADVTSILSVGAVRAARVLVEQLESPTAMTQLRAADAVLRHSRVFHTEADVDLRLTALEAAVDPPAVRDAAEEEGAADDDVDNDDLADAADGSAIPLAAAVGDLDGEGRPEERDAEDKEEGYHEEGDGHDEEGDGHDEADGDGEI